MGESENALFPETSPNELLNGSYLPVFQHPWEWDGDLDEAAYTILHQHVIQGDLTDLQVAALRWRALADRAKRTQISYRVLYEALRNLEDRWERDNLSPQEV